jgi:adenylate cyclase
MFKLVFGPAADRRTLVLKGNRVGIGRGLKNDIVLDDPSVSRNHARLDLEGNHWKVTDLGSRNGVQVNVQLISAGETGARVLRDGDRFLMGSVPFEIVRTDEDLLQLSEEKEEFGTTAIAGPVMDFSGIAEATAPAGGFPKKAQEAIDRARRALSVLASVGHRITAVNPLPEILETILELVFDSTPAERAALLLWDEPLGEQVVKVVRGRNGPVRGRFRVPRSVVDRAFKERCTIQLDPRFTPAESVLIQGIRSAVAVPLWDQASVIGTIYADSLVQSGIFDPFSLTLLSALANYAAIAIEQARLLRRIQEEERAKERLGRYHSPSVVNRILAMSDSSTNLEIPVQEADVTVLFADMAGFTASSEELSPKQVMILLNHYFGQMTDVVFENEGTLDKYIGDCLMAVFGAPLPQPDHARRAALTALRIREVVRSMDEMRASGQRVEFRIGMSSGKVVAGDVGSSRRREWTVLGATVNLASRMENLAQAGQIVLTEPTHALLADDFELRSIGAQRIKGFSRPIEAFELIGPKV